VEACDAEWRDGGDGLSLEEIDYLLGNTGPSDAWKDEEEREL